LSEKSLNKITVLVVDDDASVARAISRLLRSIGFESLAASDAPEVIQTCQARGAEIDVVLLDMHLQGTTSPETFRQMRLLNPGIKVILMSGYSRQETLDKFAGIRPNGFMLKPFGYKELETAVRSALTPE
jgi:two-component system, cell cycle sensor histidine kinase and response regulator CckA